MSASIKREIGYLEHMYDTNEIRAVCELIHADIQVGYKEGHPLDFMAELHREYGMWAEAMERKMRYDPAA